MVPISEAYSAVFHTDYSTIEWAICHNRIQTDAMLATRIYKCNYKQSLESCEEFYRICFFVSVTQYGSLVLFAAEKFEMSGWMEEQHVGIYCRI